MLTGEIQPEPLAYRVMRWSLLLSILAPWFLMGAGMTLVGLHALGMRNKSDPELWICLPGASFSCSWLSASTKFFG